MPRLRKLKIGEYAAITWIDSGASHERSEIAPVDATLARVTTTGLLLYQDDEKMCIAHAVDAWGTDDHNVEEYTVIWKPAVIGIKKLVPEKKP